LFERKETRIQIFDIDFNVDWSTLRSYFLEIYKIGPKDLLERSIWFTNSLDEFRGNSKDEFWDNSKDEFCSNLKNDSMTLILYLDYHLIGEILISDQVDDWFRFIWILSIDGIFLVIQISKKKPEVPEKKLLDCCIWNIKTVEMRLLEILENRCLIRNSDRREVAWLLIKFSTSIRKLDLPVEIFVLTIWDSKCIAISSWDLIFVSDADWKLPMHVFSFWHF